MAYFMENPVCLLLNVEINGRMPVQVPILRPIEFVSHKYDDFQNTSLFLYELSIPFKSIVEVDC